MKTAVKKHGLTGLCLGLYLCLVCLGITKTQIAAAGPILQIPDQVTVQGPQLSFMDLVSWDGEGSNEVMQQLKTVNLGAAPRPGQERIFSREYLNYILKQHHLDNEITLKMGTNVAVKRESVLITGAELRKLMEAQLPPASSNCISRRLVVSNLDDGVWLEKGDFRVAVKPLGRVPEEGSVVFQIDFFVNQVIKKTIHQSAAIKLTGLVYQAKRAIKPNELLTEADFRVNKSEIENRRQYYGGFPAGCRATKKIDVGEILARNSFQQIPLIKKGDKVTALVRMEGLEVGVTANAGRDGWLGDEIAVINSESKQMFRAKVIGENRVEVKME